MIIGHWLRVDLQRLEMCMVPGPEEEAATAPAATPVLSRRAQNKATVKERILMAARAAFIASGIGDADLVAIAIEAGVARATLYRYFDGKDALLAALMEEDWDKQADYFKRLADKPVIDEATIRGWLLTLIRATAARLDSFPIFYAMGREISMMPQLDQQRRRLMTILSARFVGFGCKTAVDRVEALLLLFQIEQFAAHAAASKSVAEVKSGADIIARQLAARVSATVPDTPAEIPPHPKARRASPAKAAATSPPRARPR